MKSIRRDAAVALLRTETERYGIQKESRRTPRYGSSVPPFDLTGAVQMDRETTPVHHSSGGPTTF
jgi:hypothetical protein